MAKGGTLWLSRSYNCVEKDPEIDKFRTLYQKEHIKESELAVIGGLATATVKNMFGGKTRQPRHATFAKMAAAMGYKYELVRDETPDYKKEVPRARQEFKEYRAAAKSSKNRKKKKAQSRGKNIMNGVAGHG